MRRRGAAIRGQERIEIERLDRKRRAQMRPRALQRQHGLTLAGGMGQREPRLGEGNLARLPGDVARQLAAADRGLGRRLLTHPGDQRRHRLRLRREIAFGGEGRLGHDIAVELRVDRLGIEGKLEPRRARVEVGWRRELEVEADARVLPIEIALGGQRIDEMRQAQIGVDLLDAPLGAVLVVDDADRAVLDPHVVQHDVAARGGEGGACGYHPKRRFGVLPRARTRIALPLHAAILMLEAHGEHRPLHDHALGIDLAAEHLAEAHIEREPRHFEIGPGAVLRIDDLHIGEHDMRTRHEEERGRAVDRELAAGLLLDARGHAIAHRSRRR